MESYIVSGALFFVMVLLVLVVYDSNATMQKIVGRLRGRRVTKAHDGDHQEVAMVEDFRAPEDNRQILHVPETVNEMGDSGIEETAVPFDSLVNLEDDEEGPTGILGWYLWYLRKLSAKLRIRRSDRGNVGAIDEEGGEPKPGRSWLGKFGRKAGADEATMAAITALQGAMNDLAARVASAEAIIEKVGELQTGLDKVSEETQIVSEDMKDILGSIRSTIDGLEGRLSELSDVVEQVKIHQAEDSDAVEDNDRSMPADEETINKLKRLEEAIADINDTIRSLPEDVQYAVSNSRIAVNNADDVSKRLEVIATNLQSTIGYRIRETFRCESCGTQGYVANQVICSNCGTTTWWGWWPPQDQDTEVVDDAESEVGDMPFEVKEDVAASDEEPASTVSDDSV